MENEIRHTENVYAFDENYEELYIGKVSYEERGERKPYFCLGCKRRMQAVYRKNPAARHFRHSVLKLPGEKPCTYRDETYRHKIAKEIIQGLKKIKVPSIYIYHPDKKIPQAILLENPKYVEAHSVVIERYIYENVVGEIELSNEEDKTGNKYLLNKPDAVFLNQKGEPILIIEFVATHYPDFEKLAKLKRLGIDAIQMVIPKTSTEEIERNFHTTKYTKWIFNKTENDTDYLQFSNSYNGGILEPDQEQRKLLEEGYKCRKARLRSLISGIEILLRQEYYQGIEQRLKSEIFRIEENTKRESSELDDLRSESFRRGIEKHHIRRRAVESQREDLEGRYNKRKREIEEEENRIDTEIGEIEFQINGYDFSGKSVSQSIAEAEATINAINERREDIIREERIEQEEFAADIQKLEKENEIQGNNIEEETNSIQRKFIELPKRFKQEERFMDEKYLSRRNEINKEFERIGREKESVGIEIEGLTGELQRRIDQITNEIETRIQNEDYQGHEWLTEDYKRMDEFKSAIKMYQSAYDQSERVESLIRDKNK